VIVIVLAALLTAVAFVMLTRLLWLRGRPSGPQGLIVLAAVVLIAGLGVLTATGRLHWLAAVGAAIVPFLKRSLGLLRWLPWIRNLYQRRSPGGLTRTEAKDVLGLSGNPSREEIIAAHRKLIQKLHPDRGGTNYLAQQLNEAKRVLLEKA
jgi:hypothetical protein